MKIIRCQDLETFMKCIYHCIEHGLTFDANADKLTINLLGGF